MRQRALISRVDIRESLARARLFILVLPCLLKRAGIMDWNSFEIGSKESGRTIVLVRPQVKREERCCVRIAKTGQAGNQ